MGLYKSTHTRTRKGGTKYTTQSRNWSGVFNNPVTGKRTFVSLGVADRKAAEILLNHKIRRAALESAGLLNPYEEHHKRPLSEHVKDWLMALRAQGVTAEYSGHVESCVASLIEWCGFKRWRDINPGGVQEYIAHLKGRGLSPCTRNKYLVGIKQFCKWLVRLRRAPESPIAYMQQENEDVDRRRVRRAFTVEELCRLIDTTLREKERYGMPGPVRVLLYLVAVETGLRAKELRSLTWNHFDLEADCPTVTIRAEDAKNRKEATLPLRAATTALLRARRHEVNSQSVGGQDTALMGHLLEWIKSERMAEFTQNEANIQLRNRRLLRNSRELAEPLRLLEEGGHIRDVSDAPPSSLRRQATFMVCKRIRPIQPDTLASRQRVFAMPHSRVVTRMLRADLKPAGIVYCDESGHYADFHALRHTFITNLARSGAHPKIAQALARHADINLTMNVYTHTVLSEQSVAIEELPLLTGKAATRKARGTAAG